MQHSDGPIQRSVIWKLLKVTTLMVNFKLILDRTVISIMLYQSLEMLVTTVNILTFFMQILKKNRFGFLCTNAFMHDLY